MTKEDIKRNLLYYKNMLLNKANSKDIKNIKETFDKAIDAVDYFIVKSKNGEIISNIAKTGNFIIRNIVSGLEFKARNVKLLFPVNGPFVSQSATMTYEDDNVLVESVLNTHLIENVSHSRFPEEKKEALKHNEKFEILESYENNDYRLAITLFNVIPVFIDYDTKKLSFRFEHQIFEMGTTFGEQWYTEMALSLKNAYRNIHSTF